MKTTLHKILMILLVVGSYSCQKEFLPSISETNKISQLTCKNGVLSFPDNISLNETIAMLSKMTLEDAIAWEDKIGFRSQSTLFRLMTKAEIMNEQHLYPDLSSEHSREELSSLGFTYRPTPEFLELERNGIAKEVKEQDGNYHKELIIHDPSLAFVINANGEVRIYEYTLQFKNGFMTVRDSSGSVMVEESLADRALTDNWTTTSNWFNDPYNGSGRRVRTTVNGSSTTSGNTFCNVTYNYSIEAERLQFGTWAKRNTYNPIYSASGSWSYQYELYNGGIFYNNLNSGSGNGSGFGYTVGSSNYLVLTLKPNGLWNTSPDTWLETVNMTSNSYYASFSGGSNGWSLSRTSNTAAQQNSGTGMNGWVYNP